MTEHSIFVDTLSQEQIERIHNWIEALRSGEFRQAQGQLNKGFSFCCLGVACQLSGLGRWINNVTDEGDKFCRDIDEELAEFEDEYNDSVYEPSDNYVYEIGRDREAGVYPPPEVVEHFGLTGHNPLAFHDKERYVKLTLADLNDEGRSFAEIANILEAELNAKTVS